MSESVLSRLINLRPTRIIWLVGAYLLVAWLAIAIIDVFDIAGLRAGLGRDAGGPVWVHLFTEAGVTEMLQWLLLGTVALVAAICSGEQWERRNVEAARFLTLLALSATLMLIEDAGNPSHRLASYGRDILGRSDFLVELIFRLPVFLVIGAVPLYAFIRYWPTIARGRDGSGFLLGGFAAYGVAAFSSVPANLLFDFYPRFGPWFAERILGGRLLPLQPFERLVGEVSPQEFTGWLFMDYVYEESIELIGVALLLAGVLALGAALRANRALAPLKGA